MASRERELSELYARVVEDGVAVDEASLEDLKSQVLSAVADGRHDTARTLSLLFIGECVRSRGALIAAVRLLK